MAAGGADRAAYGGETVTLDEQIAWLEQQAQEILATASEFARGAGLYRDYNNADWARRCEEGEAECRERAATLLTIENTLRAMRDAQG